MASKSRKTKTNKRYGTYGYGPNDHKLTSTKQALLAKFVKGDSAQSGYGVVWTSAAPENKKYHFPVMQLNNFGTYTKAKTDVLNDLQRRLDSQNHTDKEAFLIQLASELKNTTPLQDIKLKDLLFLRDAAIGKLAPASAAAAAVPDPASSASQAPTQEQRSASQESTQLQESPRSQQELLSTTDDSDSSQSPVNESKSAGRKKKPKLPKLKNEINRFDDFDKALEFLRENPYTGYASRGFKKDGPAVVLPFLFYDDAE